MIKEAWRMECAEREIAILVLADRLEPYDAALALSGVGARGFTDIRELLDCLPSLVCAGLVLDISTVMRSPRRERDRLFKLTETLPIMRARLVKNGQVVEFLDDLDVFLRNCRTICPRRVRYRRRYPTRLNVLLSREDDPAMTKPVPASVLNISESGCFVLTMEEFTEGEFVHLKILEFVDSTPILCLIRWRKTWGQRHMLPGIGLTFIDVRDAQVAEIAGGDHDLGPDADGRSAPG